MTIDKFIEGLQILRKYFKQDGYEIDAQHDRFYVFTTNTPLSEEDVRKMKELGWFQTDTDEDDEYNPEEGWSCFT